MGMYLALAGEATRPFLTEPINNLVHTNPHLKEHPILQAMLEQPKVRAWYHSYSWQVYQTSRELGMKGVYPDGLTFNDMQYIFSEKLRRLFVQPADYTADLYLPLEYMIPNINKTHRATYTRMNRDWLASNYTDAFVYVNGVVPDWVQTLLNEAA
jgi:hypothetical protein